MKICHISTGFPISYQGGITNYVRTLAEYQVKNENEVWVLTSPDNQTHAFKCQEFVSKKLHPFETVYFEDAKSLDELKRFFEEKKFDMIHIHMMLDIDWNLYEILKPYHYIVSLHDYFYLCPRITMVKEDQSVCDRYLTKECETCISWFDVNRFTRVFEDIVRKKTPLTSFKFPRTAQKMTAVRHEKYKQLLENADVLLPVSHRVKEIYANSGINGNYKVMHIGNITADRFKEEFSFDHNKKKIEIAMLGTLLPIKGADLFIELAKRLDKDKVNMNFYGRSATYAEKIKEVGIIDHGPYTQDQLAEILENTDLGCVLSTWEDNGPQVVMEFLNNHVPVIGTKMGGIPDFVNETNGFLFDPRQADAIDVLVEKINNLTIEEIYEMKKSIRPTTTTTKHCQDMDALYKEVIK